MRMIDWDKGFVWNAAAYGRTLAMTLGPLWAVLLTGWFLARRRHPLLSRIGRVFPLLRGYFRSQGLADFSFALGSFLDAGMRIDRAWAAAGGIATSPALRGAAEGMQSVIAHGDRPGVHLAEWPCFPPDFVALYHSGETTGQLEQALYRVATEYQDRADHALKLVTFVYPGVMFAAVAAAVIYHVLKFYSAYLRMIEKLAS